MQVSNLVSNDVSVLFFIDESRNFEAFVDLFFTLFKFFFDNFPKMEDKSFLFLSLSKNSAFFFFCCNLCSLFTNALLAKITLFLCLLVSVCENHKKLPALMHESSLDFLLLFFPCEKFDYRQRQFQNLLPGILKVLTNRSKPKLLYL
jgi:hypothetical protein